MSHCHRRYEIRDNIYERNKPRTAIRNYAHNCLRRDKNKLLAGTYLSAGTRGSDRHLLLTVLIQRLQIQFRRTFSDAEGNRFRMRRADLLWQRSLARKKRSDFFRAILSTNAGAKRTIDVETRIWP